MTCIYQLIPSQSLSIEQIEARFLDFVSFIPSFGKRSFSIKLVRRYLMIDSSLIRSERRECGRAGGSKGRDQPHRAQDYAGAAKQSYFSSHASDVPAGIVG